MPQAVHSSSTDEHRRMADPRKMRSLSLGSEADATCSMLGRRRAGAVLTRCCAGRCACLRCASPSPALSEPTSSPAPTFPPFSACSRPRKPILIGRRLNKCTLVLRRRLLCRGGGWIMSEVDEASRRQAAAAARRQRILGGSEARMAQVSRSLNAQKSILNGAIACGMLSPV